jgi:hypothetical protein
VPGALLNLQGTFGTSLTTGLRIDGLGSTTNNVSPIAFYIQSSNWGTQHAANIACGTLTGLDGGGYLRFSTSPDGNTAPAERLRITATGLVGIGTASPSQLLHLQGSDIGIFVKNTNSSGTSRLLFGNDLVSEAQIFYNGSTKSSFGGNGALTIYHGGNKPILFATANTERIRIDGSGRLLVGTSAGYGVASSGLARFQVGSTAADIHASLTDWSNLNQGGVIAFGAARGGAVGDYTIVQDGDNLGSIRFAGADGTDLQSQGASIAAQVDGTPGANDMPGRLTFSTTADGASTPTERLRITSAGLVGIGTSSPQAVLESKTASVQPGDAAYAKKSVVANIPYATSNITSSALAVYDGTIHAADIGYSYDGSGYYLALGTSLNTVSAPTERVRIDRLGNVGIGTSSVDFSDFGSNTGGVAIQDIGGTNTGLKIGDGSNDNYLVAAGNGSFYQNHYGSGSMIFGVGNGTGTERMRIDSSGRLLVGTSSYTGNATIVAQGHSGDSAGPAHLLLKTGNTSPASGGDLGYLFFGDANTSGGFGAWILGQRDGGTWTSGSSMPGRLQFSTTADGASSPTERFRIEQRWLFKSCRNFFYRAYYSRC